MTKNCVMQVTDSHLETIRNDVAPANSDPIGKIIYTLCLVYKKKDLSNLRSVL